MTLAASPSNEVTYVSAVRVHVLVESSVTSTVPTSVETVSPLAFSISPLIAPVNVEPLVRLSVKVESLPTRMVPSSVWPVALSVATLPAPLQPSAHTDNRMLAASSLTSFTPSRLMIALVLVTWKMWPFLLVSVPPVMLNDEVPLSASPDIDW